MPAGRLPGVRSWCDTVLRGGFPKCTRGFLIGDFNHPTPPPEFTLTPSARKGFGEGLSMAGRFLPVPSLVEGFKDGFKMQVVAPFNRNQHRGMLCPQDLVPWQPLTRVRELAGAPGRVSSDRPVSPCPTLGIFSCSSGNRKCECQRLGLLSHGENRPISRFPRGRKGLK